MRDDTFDPRDHEAFVREVDADGFARMCGGGVISRGTIPKRRDMNMMQSLGSVGTLFKSGVPFWIPNGDGGSNGLTFTGADGSFTLSAAVMTNFWMFLQTGGYGYLPAGAGGIAVGGWYFVKMTSDTDGKFYANMYNGTGQPSIPATPTALSGITTGRITQSTSEITACSATVPGGSMGPNGLLRAVVSSRGTNSAGIKYVRIKHGVVGGTYYSFGATTSNTQPSIDWECIRQNAGDQSVQTSSSLGSNRMHAASSAIVSAERTAIDTTVDNIVQMTLQISVNIDSVLGILRLATVQYGA